MSDAMDTSAEVVERLAHHAGKLLLGTTLGEPVPATMRALLAQRDAALARATKAERVRAEVEAYYGQAKREVAEAEAEVARLRGEIEWAMDTLQEINPSNYDHDQVCSLNAASVEVFLGLRAALAKEPTHG